MIAYQIEHTRGCYRRILTHRDDKALPARQQNASSILRFDKPTGGHWVYLLYDANNDISYVGRTTSPRDRIRSHRRAFGSADFAMVEFMEVDTLAEAMHVEREWLRTSPPRLNRTLNR